MQLLPFLGRRSGGWGVSGNLLLLEIWLEGGGQPLVTTLLLDGGFPTPQEPFEDEEGESLMREGEFGSQLQRKAGTAEKLPKASPTFSITSAFYPCQTVSCPLSRPSGRQTDWRQEEEV